jgi:hypothetical protein
VNWVVQAGLAVLASRSWASSPNAFGTYVQVPASGSVVWVTNPRRL